MKETTSLPDTAEKVEAYSVEELVALIMDYANPENEIKGQAGMQGNAFMVFAGLKIAKAINNKFYIKSEKRTSVPPIEHKRELKIGDSIVINDNDVKTIGFIGMKGTVIKFDDSRIKTPVKVRLGCKVGGADLYYRSSELNLLSE